MPRIPARRANPKRVDTGDVSDNTHVGSVPGHEEE
jgi:hypothetical protein